MKKFFLYIKFRHYCKKRLDKYRYRHSLAAGDMFYKLNKGNTTWLESKFVGLFHDIAHSWSYDKLLSYIDDNSVSLMQGEREEVMLLHAPVGADIFKKLVSFSNDELFNMLRFHTSPCLALSDSCYNFFIADKIDRTRVHIKDSLRKRILSEKNIEKRCLLILRNEKVFLESKGVKFIPKTQQLYDYLEEKYVGF